MNYSTEETLTRVGIRVRNYLPDIGLDTVREEILKGLRAKPKYISSKFFYDKKGSRLFEEITGLEEYYPTRTEKKILATIGKNLDLDFSGFSIIELGSGDHSKIRLLLDKIPGETLATVRYYPVDISQSAIISSAEKLADEFPALRIEGIVADFISQLHLIPKRGKRLFCFFGSTIGNFNEHEIRKFMNDLGKQMQEGDHFLLGLDMIKDISVLTRAYNDESNITAQFNKNILNVVNRLIDADLRPDLFDHIAFYNRVENRIEMHLKALEDMEINIGRVVKDRIYVHKGEMIHTEHSHKFDENRISVMGDWAGLKTERMLADENGWFSLVHYKK